MSLQRNTFIENASIILLCLICYGPAIPGSTFVFDDFVAIVRNKDVIDVECNLWTTLSRIVQHDFWGLRINDPTSHKSYRPLITLTYNIEYRLFGDGGYPMPVLMKWNNVLLHCLVCCLLLSVLRQMLPQMKRTVSYLATILFAIHPVHTEAVSGIVGRAELLCFLFYLLAVRTYCNISSVKDSGLKQVIRQYSRFFGFTAAALLCKEIGITILPFCALYDILINEKLSLRNPFSIFIRLRMNSSFLKKLLVLSVGTIVFVVTRLSIIDFTSPNFKPMDNPVASSNSTVTRILSQNYLYVLNVWLLLCPHWLSCDWSFDSIRLIHSFSDARLIGILMLYTFLVTSFIRGQRSTQMVYVCMIIPFLPASGIVKLGFVIAERILYIPSAGFCILISMGWHQLCSYSNRLKKLATVLLFFACAIFVLRTMQRAKEWRNESSLYGSALRVCPNNAKIYYNIGRLASFEHDDEKAVEYYLHAINLYPEYDAALMNLGNLYRIKNDLDTAEKYIAKSVEITEEFPAAWMNLGIVKASKGHHADALFCYNRALKYRKRYANCYYNMGNLYLAMNNSKLALQSWSQSLAINSKHSPSWANMLTLLDSQGKHQDVVVLSKRALNILQRDPAILFLRANALGKLNRYDEAEELYKEIIELRPEHALYYVNLGVLYHRWNRKSLAADSYRRALKINPNLSNVRKYLRMLQGIEGNS